MQAYKNDTKLKKAFVAEIKKHQEAACLLQGTYGKENGTWKGCAVACSLRSLDVIKGKKLQKEYAEHKRYESELGLPEWLARLEDTIFEGLDEKDAVAWPLKFSKAIPVGANLEPVKWQFCAYLMKRNIDRVLSLDISDELKKQVVNAIRGILNLHEEAIKTGKWDEGTAARSARSAWSAAWSAAESARSAAESAAESARSAAESAAWSAESAAWSARSAAESAAESARSAAWSAAYKDHAKELLRLLKAAKTEDKPK